MGELAGRESPCVRNCCLDSENLCLGCFRTLTEITGWHGLSAGERNQVLKAAAGRRSTRERRLRGTGDSAPEAVPEFLLLTHARELEKASNTGRLVLEALPGRARCVPWSRREPDSALLKRLAEGGIALLYPGGEEPCRQEITVYAGFVLLDGTWQEARKMYNQSPYLHALPRVNLSAKRVSAYHLRRNQQPGGLCTAECVLELLERRGCSLAAERLERRVQALLACGLAKPRGASY